MGRLVHHQSVVYIMASRTNGTLYIGVTRNLPSRILQHRNGKGSKFATQYGATRLVYYECTNDTFAALTREKSMKKWLRSWKIQLIEKHNPQWHDLWDAGEILPLPRP